MSCLCLSGITYERKVVFPTLSSPKSNIDIDWASITSLVACNNYAQQLSGQSSGGGCGLYIINAQAKDIRFLSIRISY